MILAHPWWVGVGFHTPFRCSDEPKALHVEPHPPEQGLCHNVSRYQKAAGVYKTLAAFFAGKGSPVPFTSPFGSGPP
ncbi:hypothetical protein CHM34_02145 [Paludifilum halophilum]|uniref:Uncharacterized protein n=1 Tax=Paludifilum halophilum TaxID=1642702 RepID=A0A235BDZ5_9BACL|nr:hypothetical protein CHM34_02145 [Paludifilum halophilum]